MARGSQAAPWHRLGCPTVVVGVRSPRPRRSPVLLSPANRLGALVARLSLGAAIVLACLRARQPVDPGHNDESRPEGRLWWWWGGLYSVEQRRARSPFTFAAGTRSTLPSASLVNLAALRHLYAPRAPTVSSR